MIFSEKEKKRYAAEIAAALDQYPKRTTVQITDGAYPFKVLSFTHIVVNADSIMAVYEDNGIQFNGNSAITKYDPISKVATDTTIFFSGMAFYGDDKDDNSILMGLDISNIKEVENSSKI